MRRTLIGVAVVLGLSALSLAALPQDPAARQQPTKYADRSSGWIGKYFKLSPDRAVATQVSPSTAECTLVAVGADYAEFEARDTRIMVPLAVLRFEVGKGAK
ncbi:MAG TPA: hypothetical protein VF384_06455 [Planctomycetota bacterium]